MSLPLTAALLDQILFAMEDQDNFSVLNLANRQVTHCEDENACGDGEGAVLPLPSWSSTDGFKMMREFSESLHNPVVQAELRTVLDSGVGVFKRFKQVLKPRDLLYRQWLRFKRRYMEEKVRLWLDQWPEIITEDPLSPAFGAEDGGLLASDFTFREGRISEAARLEDWDAEACHEAALQVFGGQAALDYAEYFRRGRRFDPASDRFWLAENPEGEWAGIVWARRWSGGAAEVHEVSVWYVDPEYRGLGVGARLLESLRTALGAGTAVMLNTPASDRRFEGPLTRAGFQNTGRLWFARGG